VGYEGLSASKTLCQLARIEVMAQLARKIVSGTRGRERRLGASPGEQAAMLASQGDYEGAVKLCYEALRIEAEDILLRYAAHRRA
jgi:hypothetical protein